MNNLVINCSHFSPDPLPRTNTVETGGSHFYAALWKSEAEFNVFTARVMVLQ